jgi:hypothetical protein
MISTTRWWGMIAVDSAIATARPRITGYTLALNYLPVAQLLAGAALVASQAASPTAVILFSLAWLYLLPPLACQVALLIFGRPHGRRLTQESRAYKVWWFTYQWQVVFNRLPWLEEILRLVPGLYALWLRLWGGRASPLAYWSPGSIAFDRPLVIVERGAVIGAAAGLVGHMAWIDQEGTYRVDIGTSRVGEGAMLAVRSGLSAGAEIAPHQMLPAARMLKPVTRWDGGKPQRIAPKTGRDDA